jgi:hypothetical protein
VLYRPAATVWHQPRATWRALAGQRIGYHSAATALAQRHGREALAPARLSWWSAGFVAALLTGRPLTAGALLVGQSAVVSRRLPDAVDQPRLRALFAVADGNGQVVRALAAATLRAWAPIVSALVAAGGPARAPLLRLVIAGVARRALDGPQPTTVSSVVLDLAGGTVDDLAACVGLWVGGWRHRSWPPLLPRRATGR